jgi:hypothetical protein
LFGPCGVLVVVLAVEGTMICTLDEVEGWEGLVAPVVARGPLGTFFMVVWVVGDVVEVARDEEVVGWNDEAPEESMETAAGCAECGCSSLLILFWS